MRGRIGGVPEGGRESRLGLKNGVDTLGLDSQFQESTFGVSWETYLSLDSFLSCTESHRGSFVLLVRTLEVVVHVTGVVPRTDEGAHSGGRVLPFLKDQRLNPLHPTFTPPESVVRPQTL